MRASASASMRWWVSSFRGTCTHTTSASSSKSSSETRSTPAKLFSTTSAYSTREPNASRRVASAEPTSPRPTMPTFSAPSSRPIISGLGRELGALTVGIMGLGNVGSALATRLLAFGSRVLYADIVERSFAGMERVPIEQLLALANIVCIHVPLNQETHHLIDAAALRRMQKGAYLINASRGPVVDERALIAALESGHLGGAGLDVFEQEPKPVENPLRRMDNVFFSPHVGGATVEAEARVLAAAGA